MLTKVECYVLFDDSGLISEVWLGGNAQEDSHTQIWEMYVDGHLHCTQPGQQDNWKGLTCCHTEEDIHLVSDDMGVCISCRKTVYLVSTAKGLQWLNHEQKEAYVAECLSDMRENDISI